MFGSVLLPKVLAPVCTKGVSPSRVAGADAEGWAGYLGSATEAFFNASASVIPGVAAGALTLALPVAVDPAGV